MWFHIDAEDPVRVTSLVESNSKRKNDMTPYDQMTKNCKQARTEIVSKWSVYLTEYDDNPEFEQNKSFDQNKNSGPCNKSVLETIASERVEDDIHPDFV